MDESHTSGFSTLKSPNRTRTCMTSPSNRRSAFSLHSPSPKGKRIVNQHQSQFEKEDLNLNSKSLRHRVGLAGGKSGTLQTRSPILNENETPLEKNRIRIASDSTKCPLLDALPNKGIVQNIEIKTPDNAYDSKKPNVRGKECTQSTIISHVVTYDAAKNCQILKTDNRNVLVRSLTICKQELSKRIVELEQKVTECKSRSGFTCVNDEGRKHTNDRNMTGATPKRPRMNNPATTPGNTITNVARPQSEFQTPNPARRQHQSPQEMQRLCVSPRLGASRVVTPPPNQTLEVTADDIEEPAGEQFSQESL